MNKVTEAMKRLEKTIGHTKRGKALFTGTMSPTDVETLLAAVKAGRAEREEIHYKILHILEYIDYEGEVAIDLIAIRDKIDINNALFPDVCVSRNGNNDTQDGLCLAGDTQPEESEDK